MIGRDDRIRTYGLCFPKAALYQTELHPDIKKAKRYESELLVNY